MDSDTLSSLLPDTGLLKLSSIRIFALLVIEIKNKGDLPCVVLMSYSRHAG